MSSEHLLLELEQLDHQAGQRLVGGGLGLDVLRRPQQHRGAVRAEPQRGGRTHENKLQCAFSCCVSMEVTQLSVLPLRA